MEAGLPQITAKGLTVFLLQRTSIEEAQAGKARLRLFNTGARPQKKMFWRVGITR